MMLHRFFPTRSTETIHYLHRFVLVPTFPFACFHRFIIGSVKNRPRYFATSKANIPEPVKYQGPMLNGKRHGVGLQTYSDGSKYKGEWEMGLRHGKGIFTNSSGQFWEGTFKEDEMFDVKIGNELQPTQDISLHLTSPDRDKVMKYKVFPNGSTYCGELENGKMHGEGKYLSSDGLVLQGEFKEGKVYNGSGVLALPSGVVFEGTWVKGALEGHGKCISKDGSVYEGNYVNGLPNGTGEDISADGFVYNGEFLNGSHHGLGVLVCPDGRVY